VKKCEESAAAGAGELRRSCSRGFYRKITNYNFINCGGRCEKQNFLFDRSRGNI
jgi:hypothetical protein